MAWVTRACKPTHFAPCVGIPGCFDFPRCPLFGPASSSPCSVQRAGSLFFAHLFVRSRWITTRSTTASLRQVEVTRAPKSGHIFDLEGRAAELPCTSTWPWTPTFEKICENFNNLTQLRRSFDVSFGSTPRTCVPCFSCACRTGNGVRNRMTNEPPKGLRSSPILSVE